MTKAEFRNTEEYSECMEKIKHYPIGFKFTIQFGAIPKPKANALRIILKDCINKGIIESVSFGLDITGSIVEEEYKRINK